MRNAGLKRSAKLVRSPAFRRFREQRAGQHDGVAIFNRHLSRGLGERAERP